MQLKKYIVILWAKIDWLDIDQILVEKCHLGELLLILLLHKVNQMFPFKSTNMSSRIKKTNQANNKIVVLHLTEQHDLQ